jgi:hypothetical protein
LRSRKKAASSTSCSKVWTTDKVAMLDRACLVPPSSSSDVPITSARRSRSTWEDAGQRSVQSSLDNCYRDQAVTNAAQLADLLRAADLPVARPDG